MLHIFKFGILLILMSVASFKHLKCVRVCVHVCTRVRACVACEGLGRVLHCSCASLCHFERGIEYSGGTGFQMPVGGRLLRPINNGRV